jgi:signal transduction histidine kinase
MSARWRHWGHHHPRHPPLPPWRGGRPFGHHGPRIRLRRRIFLWFGVSILITFLAIGAFARPGDSDGWDERVAGLERFTAGRFAEAWADSGARERLAFELAKNLDADVTVLDRDGAVLVLAGDRCTSPEFTAEPLRGDEALGKVLICAELPGGHRHVLVALLVGALILWAAAGAISYWLVRPLGEVARVAREIGDGNLGSRVDTRHQQRRDEIADLVVAINDMAERIERQIEDQRALLAAVSHEIRTPLGHLRVIAELVREGETEKLGDLEREIADIDTLVDQLLASSRLDFETIDRRPLDATDLCLRAMERADVDAGLLSVDVEETRVEGDAMLLSRALGNLLENAQRHAEKVAGVRISGDAERMRFEVEDRGPGFSSEDRARAFESFYRGSGRDGDDSDARARRGRGSLGIGLALVDRIARAHGGRAWIEDAPNGSRVGFEVARAPAASRVSE